MECAICIQDFSCFEQPQLLIVHEHEVTCSVAADVGPQKVVWYMLLLKLKTEYIYNQIQRKITLCCFIFI